MSEEPQVETTEQQTTGEEQVPAGEQPPVQQVSEPTTEQAQETFQPQTDEQKFMAWAGRREKAQEERISKLIAQNTQQIFQQIQPLLQQKQAPAAEPQEEYFDPSDVNQFANRVNQVLTWQQQHEQQKAQQVVSALNYLSNTDPDIAGNPELAEEVRQTAFQIPRIKNLDPNSEALLLISQAKSRVFANRLGVKTTAFDGRTVSGVPKGTVNAPASVAQPKKKMPVLSEAAAEAAKKLGYTEDQIIEALSKG